MDEKVKDVLYCLNEAITGMVWRIESEPETLDKSDYEALENWKTALSKFPREFWADCMLNEK